MLKSTEAIKKLQENLQAKFEMKSMGEPKCFLRLEMIRDRSKRVIYLHQKTYIQNVVDRFGMKGSSTVVTPMVNSAELIQDYRSGKNPAEMVPYASAIGSLMYCMMATRPDMAFPLNILSRFSSAPQQSH